VPKTASSSLASRAVGHAIRRARLEAGLTQSELAARMDATSPYVSGLETGRSNPTVGQLWAIADALQAELRVDLVVPERTPEPTIPEPNFDAVGR
jgi:transcriptional regulator with XRE-family HTH domain